MSRELPAANAFRRGLMGLQCVVGFGSAALVVAYLATMLRLTPQQWQFFATLVVAYAVCNFPISERFTDRGRRPIARWLERKAAGEASADEARAAFRATLDFPRRALLIGLVSYVTAGVLIAVALKLRFGDEFRSLYALVIVAATTTGGFAMNSIFFFATKRWLGPLRERLALEVSEASDRRALVRRVPLATKLALSLTGVALSTVVFSLFLAHTRARAPLYDHAATLQARLLERAARDLARDPSASLTALRREARELGLADRVELVDPAQGPGDVLAPSEWRSLLESGASAGSSSGFESTHAFAWRRLPDGRVVVAALPGAVLETHLEELWLVFGGLLALAGAASVFFARLLAGDVGRGVAALAAQAERIAGGDLRRVEVLESEDELGDLARSFETMVAALRTTVGEVATAADRLEGTASELASVGSGVKDATAGQVAGVTEARASVDRVASEVSGIAALAQGLNGSVEEASSSILELSASGDELNETARGLSERVEAVTGAVEEAVRSVRAVSAQTEALSHAASETSVSMEEMASSLREVDANAGEMARRSEQVVGLSEAGRQRMQETMEGMQAIREATAEAEAVIRNLSERTQEIGAIVDVIDDVADETNLLALNAAIIAAQAGEHGRAFSVVADEIKELADRVMASTKEISGLIRSVQEESRSAQAAMERGSRSVRSGVERSAQAGEALEEITKEARGSGQRVAEIVAAVREQSKAATHVAALMERVREGVETIRRAGSEQARGHEVVMRSSVAMREVAQLVTRTTQEQARGAGRIRDSVEGVRLTSESIHRALETQGEACARAAAGLGRVVEETDAHQQALARMADASRSLHDQAASLRREVDRFRVG